MIPASELILNVDGSVYHLGLRPEDLADTLVVVGDPERVSRVSQHFDSVEVRVKRREFITHTGYIGSRRLTVISSGIGTDNVEILLTELDALVNVDLVTRQVKPAADRRRLQIVRVGTSGSLQPDLPIDSFVASASATGLDTLMCFYQLPQHAHELAVGTELQARLGLPFRPYCVAAPARLLEKIDTDAVLLGNTITCPGFYAPQGRAVRLPLQIPGIVAQLSAYLKSGFYFTNFEMETAGYYALCRLLGHDVLSLNAIVANRITHEFSADAEQTVDRLIVYALEKLC